MGEEDKKSTCTGSEYKDPKTKKTVCCEKGKEVMPMPKQKGISFCCEKGAVPYQDANDKLKFILTIIGTGLADGTAALLEGGPGFGQQNNVPTQQAKDPTSKIPLFYCCEKGKKVVYASKDLLSKADPLGLFGDKPVGLCCDMTVTELGLTKAQFVCQGPTEKSAKEPVNKSKKK